MTSFEALYERRCKYTIGLFKAYKPALIGPDVVFDVVEKVQLVPEWLKTTQSHQKSYTYVHRRDLEFKVGDLVYLKISPLKGVNKFDKKGKLIPCYAVPYRFLSRFGKVASEIELPAYLALAHLVFHVSLLKKCIDESNVVFPIENMDVKDSLSYEEVPVDILEHQICRLRNNKVPFVKVL
ncbi:uncharacterized protein LOC107857134 [Capsicum annuum]|uniref:uncharacterized protein LOC107857134 n=1 Tax=Capsicum annuum TaxID=4072 RepID=UPI0007BEE348|nr:uncharacterized protein LOC107857134 [Capsicum annuum]